MTGAPLSLHQVFNFRDVGGHRNDEGRAIATGRVFRADGLHRLVDSDREVLGPLALNTVIDLRTDAEVTDWGHAPEAVTGAKVHHLPVLREIWDRGEVDHAVDGASFLRDRYVEMLEVGPDAFAGSLRLIADDANHGVVFHCAAGKDRTGVLAALILALCGVDDDTIAADYAATAPAMDRMRQYYQEHAPERYEVMAQQPPALLSCPAEAMHLVLDHVRTTWGSVEGLATSHLGLDNDDIAAIRAALLV